MIRNGFQVWGAARSWIIQQYVDGRVVWESDWFNSEQQATLEMLKLRRP